MADAKNYPDTIDLASKTLYHTHIKKIGGGLCPEWNNLDEHIKDQFKFVVTTILNTVNYFEGKTCKDCDYFENVACITPEGDYSEDQDRQICTNFAPKGLVGTQAGC